MAVVLPHGVLFRGAAEGHIRKHLIQEKNCLDVVIGLPANIFYGTSIPTCILLLKKNRQHKGNVLFIDASQHFGKATNQNYLRDEDLAAILDAVEKRDQLETEKADKFAYVASIQEITVENEFNLNIPRYVDTFEDEEGVDLNSTIIKLGHLETDIIEINKTINSFCSELGINSTSKVIE